MERYMRIVTLKPARNGASARIREFDGNGTSISAVVQPLSGSATAEIYGEAASQMRLMLCDSGAPLEEGVGVCVDAGEHESCDYYVCAPPEAWGTHTRAHLKWIPPQLRA